MNGLEATRQIVKQVPSTKVLILSVHNSDSLVQQILKAGALGYLLKSDATRDLVTAVEALLENKTFFTPTLGKLVLEGHLDGTPGKEHGDQQFDAVRLTARQREVVQLLAEGKSSKEIAVALAISVKTVETHRTNIMRRLGFHSVTELVRYAVRNQMIEA
jgi:DNA-binding NarL/FixJ family response regulator